MLVVDASVILHIFINAPRSEALISRLEAEDGLIAPHVLDLEVLNGLRKLVSRKQIEKKQANLFVDRFLHWPVERHSVSQLSQRIWQLRDNITPYDASYVCLAASLDIKFLTRDKKLCFAASGLAQIELV